jgi:hypothetical protein
VRQNLYAKNIEAERPKDVTDSDGWVETLKTKETSSN